MSRVAKNPVCVPSGVEVTIGQGEVFIKGPLGALTRSVHPLVELAQEDGSIVCRAIDGSKTSRAMSGTTRALVNNMIIGVSRGFERKLTLVGVGYRAQAQGDKLNLSLGYSHPVVHQMPDGVKAETPSQTEVLIKGIDKQLVGQVAAEVRRYRKPEPYKGKGVRYADEIVALRETKKK